MIGARRMSVARLLAEIAPSTHDENWTWHDEMRWLDDMHAERFAALVADIDRRGQRTPVIVGDDGRLWDGHHRVCALARLGRRWVTFHRYADLTEEERTEHLLDAIEDWENA